MLNDEVEPSPFDKGGGPDRSVRGGGFFQGTGECEGEGDDGEGGV